MPLCVFVTDLMSTLFSFEAKTGHLWTYNRLLKVFDLWILLNLAFFKVMIRKPFFYGVGMVGH